MRTVLLAACLATATPVASQIPGTARPGGAGTRASLPSMHAHEAMLRTLLGDRFAEVRDAAAAALVLIGEPLGDLIHQSLEGSVEARRKLASTRDARAVEPLTRVLETHDTAVREAAVLSLVELAAADGKQAIAVTEPKGSDWASELMGVNDRADLAEVQLYLQYTILQRLMEAGVTFQDPGSVTIEATVKIGPDVTVEPNVILRGATKIGRDTVIRAGSQLIDATIGERCQVWVVTHSAAIRQALERAPDCVSIALEKELGETRVAGQTSVTRPVWAWPPR